MSRFPSDTPLSFNIHGSGLKLRRLKLKDKAKNYLIVEDFDDRKSYWISRPQYCSDPELLARDSQLGEFEPRKLARLWEKLFKKRSISANIYKPNSLENNNQTSEDENLLYFSPQNNQLDSRVLETNNIGDIEEEEINQGFNPEIRVGKITISKVLKRRGFRRNRMFFEIKKLSFETDDLIDFKKNSISQSSVRFNNLNSWQPVWYPDGQGMDLKGINFRNMNLRNANLSGANLKNAIFIGTKLKNTNFQGANLHGATFLEADLTGASFDNIKSSYDDLTMIASICPNGEKNGNDQDLTESCTKTQLGLV